MTEKKRGRPPGKRDEEKSRIVVLIGGGMSVEDVARVLDKDTEFLRSSFAEEIATGKARADAAMLEALYAKAQEGSVSAIKEYRRLSAREHRQMPVPVAPKPEKLGKKEMRMRAALEASQTGVFKPLPPPTGIQ